MVGKRRVCDACDVGEHTQGGFEGQGKEEAVEKTKSVPRSRTATRTTSSNKEKKWAVIGQKVKQSRKRESIFCPRKPARQGRRSVGRKWAG